LVHGDLEEFDMSFTPSFGGYCTNCGTMINPTAMACTSCGFSPRSARNFCANCAARVNSPAQVMCTGCGAAIAGSPGYAPAAAPYGAGSKSKTTAGILAILLGGIGIHKFYLGRTNPGIIMAVVFGVCFCASFVFVLPFFVCMALSTVGLIEGIIMLGKSDAQFQQEYVFGQKDWF
jgi:TM2 domain-containing membrane protein YozV